MFFNGDGERILVLAADELDELVRSGHDGSPLAVLFDHLRVVFREAAGHSGGCCRLDCGEHAALVQAAAAVLHPEGVLR